MPAPTRNEIIHTLRAELTSSVSAAGGGRVEVLAHKVMPMVEAMLGPLGQTEHDALLRLCDNDINFVGTIVSLIVRDRLAPVSSCPTPNGARSAIIGRSGTCGA